MLSAESDDPDLVDRFTSGLYHRREPKGEVRRFEVIAARQVDGVGVPMIFGTDFEVVCSSNDRGCPDRSATS
jgi:hypothetical protein